MLGRPIGRARTPDPDKGFDIVLWNHQDDPGYTIMCYPTSVWWYGFVDRGEKFCLPLDVGVVGREVFEQLKNGEVSLIDLWGYFSDPFKHGFLLGWLNSALPTEENYRTWKEKTGGREVIA